MHIILLLFTRALNYLIYIHNLLAMERKVHQEWTKGRKCWQPCWAYIYFFGMSIEDIVYRTFKNLQIEFPLKYNTYSFRRWCSLFSPRDTCVEQNKERWFYYFFLLFSIVTYPFCIITIMHNSALFSLCAGMYLERLSKYSWNLYVFTMIFFHAYVHIILYIYMFILLFALFE